LLEPPTNAGADLVVMGAYGRGMVGELFGSRTEALLHHTDKPILFDALRN
jgi:nucleotide-binding universal stress UspA family protein